MWIENNLGLCFAAAILGWIVVGAVIAAARNAIDSDCASDRPHMLGARVVFWPLEFIILVFQILFLVVSVLAVVIVRILTCKL